MTHFIDAVLGPVLWSLADWSLRWAVLIAVLAVTLQLCRPRRAATRHLLCLATLLAGLLLPAVPRWGIGWRGWREEKPPIAAVSATPASPEQVPLPHDHLAPRPTDRSDKASRGRQPPDDSIHPGADAPGSPLPEVEPWRARHIVILSISLLWISGMLVLLLRWWCGCRFLGRLRREATGLPGSALDLLEVCRAELGVKRSVNLAAHRQVRSPVLLGLLRPIILVPPHWPELPSAMQRAGLLHELAHLKRRDDWLAVLLALVRIVFFFHPLVHWLLARLEQERELLCDEMAVGRGIDPRAYAAMLLEFARASGRFAPLPSAGLSYLLPFGRRRTVKARIHHLLEENMERWMGPLPARRAVVLGLVVLGLALGIASYRLLAREPEKSAAAAEPPKPPAAPAGDSEKPPPAAKAPATEIKREALRYGGKNFDQWRTELVTELKPAIRVDGLKALAAFGANGYGPEATRAILDMMRGYDVTSINNTADDDLRVVQAADLAVNKIGPVAVPILTKALRDDNRNVRRFAASALIDFGPDARAAVPALLRAIKDDDPKMREQAISDVQRIDPQAKGFVPALIEALKDERSNIRILAAKVLGSLGRAADPAIPALVEVLKDTDLDVRAEAMAALNSIHAGPQVVPAVSRLIRELPDPQGKTHPTAYQFLTALGPKAKEAVPALIAVVKGPKDRWRLQAVWALGAIGPDAKDAVPALTELLRSEDEHLRGEAAGALKKIAP